MPELPELPEVEVFRRRSRRIFRRRIARVLKTAIECRAGSEGFPDRLPRRFPLPARGPDGSCPRCGRSLATFRLGGRTGYCCPRCQSTAA